MTGIHAHNMLTAVESLLPLLACLIVFATVAVFGAYLCEQNTDPDLRGLADRDALAVSLNETDETVIILSWDDDRTVSGWTPADDAAFAALLKEGA